MHVQTVVSLSRKGSGSTEADGGRCVYLQSTEQKNQFQSGSGFLQTVTRISFSSDKSAKKASVQIWSPAKFTFAAWVVLKYSLLRSGLGEWEIIYSKIYKEMK